MIAYDEQTRQPVWAPVSQYSIHVDREVEIVNLSGDAQIITDDDPRAVYGVDPTTPGFKMERFTPTQARDKNVLVTSWVPWRVMDGRMHTAENIGI